MKAVGVLFTALSLAQANKLETVRNLATVDVINLFLEDLSFTIDLGDEIEIPLYTLEPIVCDGFALGDLFTTATLDEGQSPELQLVEIGASGLQFSCSISLTGGLFVPNIDTTISSVETSFKIPLNFYSDDFGRIIPTQVEADPAAECLGDIVVLDIDLGNAILNVVDIDSIVEDSLCPILELLLANVSSILSDNILTDLAGTRVEQPESIIVAVVEAEEELLETLPVNFTYFNQSDFQTVGDAFLDNILASPMVTDVAFLGFQLLSAFQNNDTALVESLLEEILLVLLEQEVDIPTEFVEYIVTSGIIDDVLSGDLSVQEIIVALFDLFDLDLPTTEEVEAFFDTLPDFLQTLLAPVEEFIIDLLDVLGGSRALQSDDGVVTIGDLLQYIPPNSPLFQLLSGLDQSESVLDVLTQLLTGTTLEMIFGMITLPQEVDVKAILQYFGRDSTIVDVFNQLSDLSNALSTDLGLTLASGVAVSEPLPESILEILELLSTVLPQLQPIVEIINNFNGTLEGISGLLAIDIPLGDFGNLTLALDSFGVDLDFSLDTEDSGFIEESSLILPEVDLANLYFGIGLAIGLTDGETVYLDDVLELSVNVSFTTQEALTFGFAFVNLVNFEFFRLTSLPAALDVLLDYAICFLSSTGGTLSAQITTADVVFTFESVTGDLSGLIEDAVSVFADMYLPLIPTVIENLIAGLTEDLPFLTLGETEACYANHASSAPEDDDGDDEDEEEEEEEEEEDDNGKDPQTKPAGEFFADDVSGAGVVFSVLAVAVILLGGVGYGIFNNNTSDVRNTESQGAGEAKASAFIEDSSPVEEKPKEHIDL